MPTPAHLVLEDGSAYEGLAFGAEADAFGEVVFNTSMTGYQEMLTDPSYAGQIVVPTYPLIGNYGVNERDFESRQVQVAGFVVREHCPRPSHSLSTRTLDDFLADQGVSGISDIDTRAVTRRIRTCGVMMGAIAVGASAGDALEWLRGLPRYDDTDFVSRVTADAPYSPEFRAGAKPVELALTPGKAAGEEAASEATSARRRIVIDDCGLKYNIMRILQAQGCEVVAVPAGTSAGQVLDLEPDGVVMSPGPGDPELLDYAVETARGLAGKVPMLGICLGNQVIARAFGGRNYKLKFGHRGGNHPVRDNRTGLVHITAQNHGYAVDPDSLPADLEVSHINLNDGTVEGLRHRTLPVMSIQYHSEASPGPLDNEYIFTVFLEMVQTAMETRK